MDQATLVRKLRIDYPSLEFIPAKRLCWSPRKQQVFYQVANDNPGVWGLLHELGHAELGHVSYETDVELVSKEAQAWKAATIIGQRYHITIEREHIENCLDTYRDWLHRRSTCPTCGVNSLQKAPTLYICVNCHATWLVTHSKFCRPYRRFKNA